MLGGYGNGSSVNNAGSNAYYWSSTFYNTTNAYILNFNSSSVNPQNNNNKNNGHAVRCVKKSERKGRMVPSDRDGSVEKEIIWVEGAILFTFKF